MAPASPSLAWGFLAGAIGFVWGLSEIIGAFKNETGRALRTGGAWLLVWLNFGAAAGIFLLVASIIPDANNWLTAVFVGFAWPTIIRNTSFKLAQPLQSEPARDTAVVRFEQAYGTIQDLARQLINNTLTLQRMKLVTTATQYDLGILERYARLAQIASPLQGEQGASEDSYIDRIMQRQMDDELKKAYLAAFILTHFGRDTLDDFLKAQRKGKTS